MAEEKRATLPPWSPRHWHGMTAGVWFPYLWQNRFAASPSRVPMAGAISLASIVNSVLRQLSEATYGRRSASVAIEHAPVFVIGHWRTGTTWLHELMVRDDRFMFPTTYQCMSPHHFLLTNSILSHGLNMLMPRSRPMDNMPVGMSRPQEDEFALMNLGLGSPYLDWGFPDRDEHYLEYLTLQDLDASERENWKIQFEWFVRRLTQLNPRRLVLKSPTHTARVATLLEVFPQARFIHIVRNPLDFIPSTIRTWTRMTDAKSIQVRRDPIPAERIFALFDRMYDQFEKDRERIPPEHICELRYEDLVAAPIDQLQRIYRHLDLGDFTPARPAIEDYLRSIEGYQRNRHQVASELKDQIHAHCRAYIDKYGYRADWNDSAAIDADTITCQWPKSDAV